MTILKNNSHGVLKAKAVLMLFLMMMAVTILLAAFSSSASAQSLEKLNRFLQTTNASDSAMKIFSKGRDEIEEQKWNRASDSFNRFISENPKHQNVDAAMYWLAFALKKQGKFQEADNQLARLMKDYPNSRWLSDAKAMRAEIAPEIGRDPGEDVTASEDEIKIIALQSLVQSSPERAATMIGEILKPNSKHSNKVKQAAIGLLGQLRSEQATPILIDLARNQTDPKLRRTAIFWLGQSRDESVLDVLRDIAVKATDDETATSATFAISQNRSPKALPLLTDLARNATSKKVKQQAIFALGQRRDDSAIDELIKLADSEQDAAVRKQLVQALSMNRSAKAQAKLLEIARTSGDSDVRRYAIFWVGQQQGEEGTDLLIQWYDSEKDEKVKDEILSSLGQKHGSKKATQKMMTIARSDSSLERRKRAIFWLGQSKDPEATKFLEDILK